MLISAEGRLRRAVYLAFAVGTAGSGFAGTQAFAQVSSAADSGNATQLQKIEVTGSRIRRVETETADPVITLDRAFINNSGANTAGQLLQQLPNIGGGNETPAVNNAGNGESNIGLRGLTSARTLLLLDGQRTLSTNVDAIPVNMIERVEIVKDGASAIYGSDAIGGVINIITRKHFSGFEATAQIGTSEYGDGTTTQYTGTWGASSKNGHVVLGMAYTNQDQIVSSDRTTTQNALALYNGATIPLGSGTGVNGAYTIPAGANASAAAQAVAAPFGCTVNNGTIKLARNPGASGSSADTANYHCFGNSDTYNFQAVNLTQLPEQRFQIFGLADYKLFDDIYWEGSAIYHNQTARSQIAPEPFTSTSYGVTVSGQNFYNPFGEDLSALGLRLASAGNRVQSFDTHDLTLTTGFHGTLLDQFTWSGLYTYQRESELIQYHGQLFIPAIGSALGPSVDQNTCGTPGNTISGCTPINFFGTPSASSLSTLFPNDFDNEVKQQNIVEANISGDVLTLPAGPVGVAVGYQYRALKLTDTPDYLIQNGLVTDYSNQSTNGGYDVNEVYAEARVPLLAKLPAVYDLTLDVGGRFSDYSNFGSTKNGKYGMEYRPVRDILVRASYADVFRAPTINNLFGGTTVNAAPVTDPCNGLTTAGNPACANIAPDGTFKQGLTQYNVNDGSNPNLKPEKGYTTNFGIVVTPTFFTPLTVNFDYFLYSIKGAIATVSLQNSLDLCYSGIDPSLCGNIVRDATGNITTASSEPLSNVGSLLTKGFDAGIKLDFGKSRFGRFSGSVDGTYLQKYLFQVTPVSPTVSLAGQFNPGTATDQDGAGNYARVRVFSTLSWSLGDFNTTVINRFISGVNEDPTLDANGGGTDAAGNPVHTRFVDYADYTDITVSYAVKPIHSALLLGVNNVGNKQAPLIYSGFNGNTDASTYDTIGRFYFARVTVSFK